MLPGLIANLTYAITWYGFVFNLIAWLLYKYRHSQK